MTKEQFLSEKQYQISMQFILSLLEKELITPDEAELAEKLLLEKYKPIISSITLCNT